MNHTSKGITLSQAIDKVQKNERNKYFKYFLNAMKISLEEGIDLNYTIEEVENQILNDQKDNVDDFILHTNKSLMWVLYSLFLPFFFLIIEIVNWVFESFFDDGEAIIDDQFRLYYFIFTLAALALLSLATIKRD
jgi:hypothetical protein